MRAFVAVCPTIGDNGVETATPVYVAQSYFYTAGSYSLFVVFACWCDFRGVSWVSYACGYPSGGPCCFWTTFGDVAGPSGRREGGFYAVNSLVRNPNILVSCDVGKSGRSVRDVFFEAGAVSARN